jgi:hypothetical protein
MGDPVTASIVAGGVIGTQAYIGGRQARNQAKMQAAQLTTEQKAIKTNAAIEQAERMNKLKTVLAAQNAAFAMSGQTAGVGSASAIQSGSISQQAREQRIANLQTDIATSAYDFNIWSAKKAAKTAMANTLFTTALNTTGRVAEAYVMNSFNSTPTQTQPETQTAGGKK